MGRRSKDERREHYLDLGAELVAEATVPGTREAALALSHVKIADVADRAGVTKGALYHLWDSQEAYWDDLLQHLLDGERLFGGERIVVFEAELRAASADDPTLRGFANAVFDSMRDDAAFFARISLFAYPHDDELNARLDGEFHAALDHLVPALEAALAGIGRRFVDHDALARLAVAITALLEGMCLQYRISPQRTPDLELDGRRWSLFAAAAEALVMAHTVALDPGSSPARSAGASRPGTDQPGTDRAEPDQAEPGQAEPGRPT